MATLFGDIFTEKAPDRSGRPFYGVIVAVVISAPIWAVAFGVYARIFS